MSRFPRIVRSEYPDEGWLRGYFLVGDDSGHQRIESAGQYVKNVDFLRLRDVALHLLDPKAGMTILDIGCADGATMVYCGLQGATMYGIDLSHKSVGAANKSLEHFRVAGRAICGDATKLPFPNGFFDGVISSDFFEHITDEQKAETLEEAYRVLKPGRPLVIKTPNLRYLRLSLSYKRVRAILRLRNPWRIVIPHTPGTQDPQHIGLTTRSRLARQLVEAGFLNYRPAYGPFRRFGYSVLFEMLSTEIPVLRDWCSEDLVLVAWRPIVLSYFPD